MKTNLLHKNLEALSATMHQPGAVVDIGQTVMDKSDKIIDIDAAGAGDHGYLPGA